jgi:hypothetical protein
MSAVLDDGAVLPRADPRFVASALPRLGASRSALGALVVALLE